MGWNDVADLKLHFHARTPDWLAAKDLVSIQPGLYPIDDDQTLRELLIHNLDFQAIPKRHFFKIMANHTDDPMHKARLLEFQDPLYTDEFTIILLDLAAASLKLFKTFPVSSFLGNMPPPCFLSFEVENSASAQVVAYT
ncbi:hypothetical protein DID88_009146 [Monilinia fructigena]|uniref:Uncharacterized protein n=1 Tax=Monilinia fructigena TaxID=38457 RepID=A0A395IF65_9HELO|nr:hypothetical protein DID88_009146 [Monilinia fructigena]